MKVVVRVQAKRSSGRGLAHYIAHSKFDAEREPSGRALFGEKSDEITVEKANLILSKNTTRKRAANDELHHLVLSVKAADFASLGAEENERRKSLREMTRAMMKTLAEKIGADKLNWAAGIHRNTANPHVHIALQKSYFDKDLNRRELTKIPRELLPHFEKDGTEKTFASGALIDAATATMQKLAVHERKAERTGIHKEVDERRDILARALLAEHRYAVATEALEALQNDGERRRFKIHDPATGRKTPLSIQDIRDRASRNAEKKLSSKILLTAAKREELRVRFMTDELRQNADGMKQIKAILFKLFERQTRVVEEAKAERDATTLPAEAIRRECRQTSSKLPIPNLSSEELDKLQERSLETADFRAAYYLERVRSELSAERGTEARTAHELEELKGQRTLSEIRLQLGEKKEREFLDRQYWSKVELEGESLSLGEIERRIAAETEKSKSLTGRVRGLFANSPTGELTEKRVAVVALLQEKESELSREVAIEKLRFKTLDSFLAKDESSNKETIEPRFNAKGLAEIESASIELKRVDLFRAIVEAQMALISENSANAQDVTNFVAGRALAREVLAEIEAARTYERLKYFEKNKQFAKFPFSNEEETRFVSLADVKFDGRGSILDQTLEFLLEDREKRATRRQLETLIKEKSAELKSESKGAKEILKIAAADARPFQSQSIFGSRTPLFTPIFTPTELALIGRRIAETPSRAEKSRLTQIAALADPAKSKHLAVLLDEFRVAERPAKLPARKWADLSEEHDRPNVH